VSYEQQDHERRMARLHAQARVIQQEQHAARQRAAEQGRRQRWASYVEAEQRRDAERAEAERQAADAPLAQKRKDYRQMLG
jgi:hypothetical protein